MKNAMDTKKMESSRPERARFDLPSESASKHRSALRARLLKVESALARETWLPMGLRTLLAHELPRLRRELQSRKRFRREAASHRVRELAMATFRYGPELLDSEAVAQLRVLDLELNPARLSDRVFAGSAREHDEDDRSYA